MPIHLEVTLNGNTFKADGEPPDLVSMYRSWLNAQNLDPSVTVEELTERLKANNNALAQLVSAHTPQE